MTVIFALGLAALWAHAESRRWARGALVVTATGLVAVNVAAMESVRAFRTPPAEDTWAVWERLQYAGAPAAVVAAFKRIGWPFVWPASIPFALRHHVPIRTFEEVYGAYFCYRDSWDHGVRDAVARLDQPGMRRYLVSGFGRPDARTGLVPVEGTPERPARMLAPLFRSEPMRVHLEGAIPANPPPQVRWNGEPVPAGPHPDGLVFELPGSRVRHEINELRLVLPPRSRLAAIRFEPTGPVSPDFRGPPWDRKP